MGDLSQLVAAITGPCTKSAEAAASTRRAMVSQGVRRSLRLTLAQSCASGAPRRAAADVAAVTPGTTTSSAEPLNCALAALGNDRVMFAADYPFEQSAEAGEFLDKTPLAETVRGEIAFKNAVREFKLPAP